MKRADASDGFGKEALDSQQRSGNPCYRALLTLESNGVQVVKDNLLHHLVYLLLLSQDDIALPLDGGLLELAVLQDIADDIHCFRHIISECFGVVDGLLPAGVGVQVCAQVLDLQLQGMLIALASSFEGHVFEEVRSSFCGICLCARACIDPYSYGRSLGKRLAFGSNGESVGEGSDLGRG